MRRRTKVVGFSVPPEVAREYAQMAKRQGKSKSELFREIVAAYKENLQEEEFLRLQKRMTRSTRQQGILDEKEVERIVFEDR